MKKKYSNKAIEESPETKSLVCIKRCDMPNIGYFVPGDEIKKQSLIKILEKNSKFFKRKEEK